MLSKHLIDLYKFSAGTRKGRCDDLLNFRSIKEAMYRNTMSPKNLKANPIPIKKTDNGAYKI